MDKNKISSVFLASLIVIFIVNCIQYKADLEQRLRMQDRISNSILHLVVSNDNLVNQSLKLMKKIDDK